jgi:hypothetical protein
MQSGTPVVTVYGQGTSWQLASLGGESPRRVLVRGNEVLVHLVGSAFPEADVRAEGGSFDEAWADLIVEEDVSKRTPRHWVDRILRPASQD